MAIFAPSADTQSFASPVDGSIYLLAVALGSLAGFGLALFSDGRVVTHFGFGSVAILWFFTGWMAYRYARAGRIEEHCQWMIRNFSLSLAAITLRHYLPFMLSLGRRGHLVNLA